MGQGHSTHPIHSAGRTGDVCTVRRYLRNSAILNRRDGDEMTCLHWAAQLGHIDIVQEVVEAGAQLDVQDYNGWTSLMHACCRGHKLVVGTLLRAGAAVDIESNDGRTALHRAATWKRLGPLDQLIDAGADVRHEAVNKWTPLHCAAAAGDDNACRMLLEAGADPNARDCADLTPIDVIADISAAEAITKVLARAMKRTSTAEPRSHARQLSTRRSAAASRPTAEISPASCDEKDTKKTTPLDPSPGGSHTGWPPPHNTQSGSPRSCGESGSRHEYPYRETSQTQRKEPDERLQTEAASDCNRDHIVNASENEYVGRGENGGTGEALTGGKTGKPPPPRASPGAHSRRAKARVAVACDESVPRWADVQMEGMHAAASREEPSNTNGVFEGDRHTRQRDSNGMATCADGSACGRMMAGEGVMAPGVFGTDGGNRSLEKFADAVKYSGSGISEEMREGHER